MLLNPETTISDIVRNDYRTAEVFKKHRINFCCGGQVSLEAACSTLKLDYEKITKELEEATRNIYLSSSLKFSEWKTDFLIDYLINVHHAYLEQALPSLELRLTDFTEGHKKKYPALIGILETFHKLAALLHTHNKHEEEIIFPYIKQIDSAYRRKEPYANLFVRTLRKPLSNIEREHKVIGELLNELKQRCNDYMFPSTACTNHQVLYHKLKEFHNDMIQHKHLENNILFPKSIEIERQLLQI